VAVIVAGLLAWDLAGAMGFARHRTADRPAAVIPSSGPVFFLFMGSDARRGTPVLRGRSDAMLLVGVNRHRHRATILGLHRDTWVHIPGHGWNKINAALAFGGPALAVTTVRRVTGIPVDGWLVTSFRGFRRMISAVGGIDLNVPFPMYDIYSGSAFDPGRQRLLGSDALAFVRARHNIPGFVFGRTHNQGVFARSSLHQYLGETRHDRSRRDVWTHAGMANMKTNLTMMQVMRLASLAAGIPASRVDVIAMPARRGRVGSKMVVFITQATRRLFANMRRDGIA